MLIRELDCISIQSDFAIGIFVYTKTGEARIVYL